MEEYERLRTDLVKEREQHEKLKVANSQRDAELKTLRTELERVTRSGPRGDAIDSRTAAIEREREHTILKSAFDAKLKSVTDQLEKKVRYLIF